MLRNNSTPKNDNSANATQQPLLFNTSTVNAENLQECLSISNEIQRQEQLQQLQRRFSHPTPLEATMTHEEIYDCSFEDDRFLTALEYQNSLGARQVTDLDASQCFGDAMKYFDEDVNVDSGVSRCDTPTKLPATGTVAAVVANFQTQLSKSMGSPPPPYQEHASPKTPKEIAAPKQKPSNIQELLKKYEQAALEQQRAEQKRKENEQRAKDLIRSAPAALPAPKKKAQKSKVKQMAHMFNSKIVQLMRRDSSSKKNYAPLDNAEASTSHQHAAKPVVLKPANKPRSRLPIYRGGLPSPVPSPRFKRRHQKNNGAAAAAGSQSSSDSEGACLIAEDVFRKLSVKDKALLYNKFIEDMTKQHPQFQVHARFVEAHVQQELERSEREQKSPKVKEMARELEARFSSGTPQISPWAMKRLAELQKTPEYEAATKLVAPMPASAIEANVLSMQVDASADNQENDASDAELEAEELHISSLTVVLKTSTEEVLPQQRAVPRILPRKEREQRFINDMRMIERSQKRNNESMRSSVSFEACGPPKKIRRTRAERLQPKAIFQNAYMERMFYNWIMEKNGVTFDITTVDNSEDSLCAAADETNTSKSSLKSKSRVHMLLEKAIAKLESVEARVMRRDSAVKKTERMLKIINETKEQCVEEKNVIEVQLSQSKTATTSSSDEVARAAPNRAQRKVKRQAPPPPTIVKEPEPERPQPERYSTSSSNKSEAESESGLSSLPKNTSDESQPEQAAPPAAPAADFEYAAPNKPARKKKLRRTLTWKKDSCMVECQTMPSTTTTDSESDHKAREDANNEVIYANIAVNLKKSPKANRNIDNEIKEMAAAAQKVVDDEQQNKTREEVANFLNTLNTPQKIKASYTLTTLSTPTTADSERYTPTESDHEVLRRRSMGLTAPTMVQAYLNNTKPSEAQMELGKTFVEQHTKTEKHITEPADTMQQLIDSFIDLGFETGSNDSPTRRTPPVPAPRKSKSATPLFIKLTPDLEKTLQQNRSSFSSTPVRGFQSHPQVFTSNVARQLQQQQQQQQQSACISPISTLNNARRRSLQADDSRRSSLAMQVISEDRPLEQVEHGQTPCSPTTTDMSFFGNSFNMSLNADQLERPSKFWVRAGDFTISLDVFYNSPDRLQLLYDIFCQKSCETRDLHFGIDDHKYTVHNLKDKADISTRLPKVSGCSHYWFSTGDLAVPFNGKYLAPEKVERLFNFINDSMTDRAQLRFGIDDFEFSRVPESWACSPKFSMESSYSMLLGLQGSSNGLEGRSRYAWPNSIYSSAHSNTNSIKTRDLDFSEFGSDFDSSEIRLLTESPCGSNYYDMLSSVDSEDMTPPRQSTATRRENFFKANFEVESLDKLFEEDQKNAKNKPADAKETLTVPEMLNKLQAQKVKLSELEKRLRTYSNHSGMAGAILPHSKESPIYMQKLRNVIKAIDNIGGNGGDGFKACSMKQLESFMYFLTRYADICLANCNDHMSKVLDVLLEHQQQQRDELMQTNGELGVA